MAVGTLAQELESAAIDFDQLERDYRPMLRLVRELIGIVPNCDRYLEIWPIGFRSYNLLVPNLLNMPGSLLGKGAPKELVGLGMYVSSRAAECMYCAAHTCSYALRRGASPEAVTGNYNEVEAAVASVAESLGRVPSDLTQEQVFELDRHLSPQDVEWVLYGIALMGYLNKFMDTMGVELEAQAIADVQELIEPTGWTTGKHQWDDDQEIHANGAVPKDSLGTYLKVFRHGPRAARLDSRWTTGVSGQVGAALMMLETDVGYAFPILASLRHKKPVKAIATVLRDNLDRTRSEIGLPAKCFAGLVFAKVVQNEMLVAEMVQLSNSMALDIDPGLMVDVVHFADQASEKTSMPNGLSTAEAAAVILAKATSTSPSNVTEITIATVTTLLTPEQIVEIVVWLSVLQMLHRLYAYHDARIGLS